MTTGIIHTVYSVGFPWASPRPNSFLNSKLGSKRPLLARTCVHRHMTLAVGSERRAVPPRPSFHTLKSCQLSHQIKLARPGVAHEMRDHPRAVFAYHDALKSNGLGHPIVYRDLESGGIYFGPGTLHALTIHILREVGHDRLHNEHTFGA